MPGLLPDVDPDGLLEYSVVYTDRALNHMARRFHGVMQDVSAALKEVYRAKDADAGAATLEAFAAGDWGRKYPAIALSWRRHWPEVIPFFAFPMDVRRIVYTTNAIEALNAKLRRAVRTRGHFPSDEAALKLLYLVLNLAEREWRMPPKEWGMARAQLAILFEDRFELA